MELTKELPKMSWRRFLILLKGLGPNSVFVISNNSAGNATETEQSGYIDQIF